MGALGKGTPLQTALLMIDDLRRELTAYQIAKDNLRLKSLTDYYRNIGLKKWAEPEAYKDMAMNPSWQVY